ncbi:hypothetical protein TNCT_630561 [Trichonephila clavata]|uniref:Uncharacterized protein n=1 Tax=Trichonephila clavata TaxID=2740835 RepID=A0A8X6HV66_TRICU|nr:hypothetical protein TNCT_630561 [Trichonephila clavata]
MDHESNTSHSTKGLPWNTPKRNGLPLPPTSKVTRFKPLSVIVQPSEAKANATSGTLDGTKSAKGTNHFGKAHPPSLHPPPPPQCGPSLIYPFRCPLMHFSDAGREPLLMDEFNGRLGQKGWMKGAFRVIFVEFAAPRGCGRVDRGKDCGGVGMERRRCIHSGWWWIKNNTAAAVFLSRVFIV